MPKLPRVAASALLPLLLHATRATASTHAPAFERAPLRPPLHTLLAPMLELERRIDDALGTLRIR